MSNNLNLQDIRKDYIKGSLDETSVDDSPFNQFKKWFDEAVTQGVSEPNAMTLATATKDGIPSARIVLLKEMDERGFMFATNYESRKGGELEENPVAALLFFWGEMERQVRIEGRVEKVSWDESNRYFQSRPRESRIGAWASKQSEIAQGREEIEQTYNEMVDNFTAEVPLPPFWGGFRLIPVYFEFWQGRASRLHDRICYSVNEENEWDIVRLFP